MSTEIKWEQVERAIEVAAPLRFGGSEADMAEQFLLAAQVLSEKVYSGGQIAVDYEQAHMPESPGTGRGFGGWLESALPLLLELEEIAEVVAEACDREDVESWIGRRLRPKVSTAKLAAERDVSKRYIRKRASFVDKILVGELRRRGYVVRGQ